MYKKLIVDSGKRMLNSGLTVETWGNISARDAVTGLVYLTPGAIGKPCLLEQSQIDYMRGFTRTRYKL